MKISSENRFLFIETFLLGDMLYLGPLISALRLKFPGAKIEVMGCFATRGFPFFDNLDVTMHHFDFPWSRVGWHLHPLKLVKSMLTFKRQFRGQFRDFTVLDPRGDLRHRLAARLLKPLSFIQYHSSGGGGNLLRETPPHHIFTSRMEFTRQLGLSGDAITGAWLKKTDAANSKVVLLAPESSLLFNYWKSDRWKLLSGQLQMLGFRTVLLVHRGNAVTDIRHEDFDEVWRGSLPELGRLVSGARVVIAVDSFIGHLAGAMDVPVISLFGTQVPEHWRPMGKQTAVVIAEGYSCRPCTHRKCVRPHDNCMDAIRVDQVMQAFKKLMAI